MHRRTRGILLPATLLAIAALYGCANSPPSSPPPAATAFAAAKPVETMPAQTKPITPAAAEILAQNCFACHGPMGVRPGAIPALNGLSAARIKTQLHAFKSGERPSTVMGRHAKGYNDAEIEALANYLAGLGR